MSKKKIVVSDGYQKSYIYECVARVGRDFEVSFTPELTPQEMLRLGIFGGKYFSDRPKEFPEAWWRRAKLSNDGKRHAHMNFFGVNASQSLKKWKEKGWIHSDDPRGWFQWYCRYYMGRRCADDARQIKRWRAMRRHVAQVEKGCMKGDFECRKRQKQALLHWAYDARTL